MADDFVFKVTLGADFIRMVIYIRMENMIMLVVEAIP
jgi:hypothetical protein